MFKSGSSLMRAPTLQACSILILQMVLVGLRFSTISNCFILCTTGPLVTVSFNFHPVISEQDNAMCMCACLRVCVREI